MSLMWWTAEPPFRPLASVTLPRCVCVAQKSLFRMDARASVDAYFAYNALVGESDGGRPLPQREYDALVATARHIVDTNQRLYVNWTSGASTSATQCHAVGGATRCFCGHMYKSHAWMNVDSKKLKCRVPGCRCKHFGYVPGRGSRYLRCSCKHEVDDHRDTSGRGVACRRGCGCMGFHNDGWRCGVCGKTYDEHVLDIFQHISGSSTTHGNSNSVLSAAGGGLVGFTSLLPTQQQDNDTNDTKFTNQA